MPFLSQNLWLRKFNIYWTVNIQFFPFLLCFLLLFFSQLFVSPSQTAILLFCISFSWGSVAGQSEVLRPWQRSWGRRLDIRKGRVEPQESPWKSSSIYPHNQSLPTLLLCAHLHLWLYGGLSPTTFFGEGVNLELQLIKTPGCDKSVLTYNSSEGSLACLTGLSGHLWSHTDSQPW